jgi:hypothetical protein
MAANVPDRSSASAGRRLLCRLLHLPAFGVLAVPAIVVPAILWARIAFHARHPDADPAMYLTISRAISDPAVGEPFAFWVTLAACLLWPATHLLFWMFARRHPARAALAPARDLAARVLFVPMSIAMTMTCVGMVILARWRLGGSLHDHDMHMIGSWVFFAGQSSAIFAVALYHALIAPAPHGSDTTAFFPVRWRARIGFAVVALAALYGVIFHVKAHDFGVASPWVVAAYVELETILIVVFLAYLALFWIDVVRFLRESASTVPGSAPAPDPAGR